mmetsp:Transcript_28505/g.43830  ORF Transcript_28505/g.43830 Transcript_28505/m.43830 type:complete len:446 (-) Transcript_28505:162-1499(-)
MSATIPTVIPTVSPDECSDEEATQRTVPIKKRKSLMVECSSSDESSPSSEKKKQFVGFAMDFHQAPSSTMMVDHKYTDYSIIDEHTLMEMDENDDEEGENKTTDSAKISDEDDELGLERKVKLERLRKMSGKNGPTRKNSGGVVQPFPEKLMEVLERGDMDDIISWMPHGRAFIVKQPKTFVVEVLPRFFKQSKFMSFTRQLNLWGFKRITKGPDQGSYYHELFLRGKGRLVTRMKRQKIKGTGIKLTPNPEQEPDFYKMSDVRPLPKSTKKTAKPLPPLPPQMPGQPGKIPEDNYGRDMASLRQLSGTNGLLGNGIVGANPLAGLRGPLGGGVLDRSLLNNAYDNQTMNFLLEAQLRREQQDAFTQSLIQAHNATEMQRRMLANSIEARTGVLSNQAILRSREQQILGGMRPNLGGAGAMGANDPLLQFALQQELLKRAQMPPY